MRRTLIVLLSLGAASCDVYGPELGDTPFLCGDELPTCPDGYGEDYADGVCKCKAGVPEFACNDDPKENNDDISVATPTPVDLLMADTSYGGLSICPPSDLDFFHIHAGKAKTRFTITVGEFDTSRPAPTLQIVGPTGAEAALGSVSGDTVIATYTTATVGDYYIKVSGIASANYSLVISSTVVP
jgi:hypothetical protein